MFESIGPWIAAELAGRLGIGPLAASLLCAAGIFLLSVLGGAALEWIIRALTRRSATSRTRIDDVVTRAIHGPTRVLATLYGIGLSILVLDLPEPIHAWTRILLGFLVGVSIVVILARLLASAVEIYGSRAHLEGPARNVARKMVTFVIWSLGLLLVARAQGIDVTPLLTTLGLAGLAVALAFQDTLTNLFAGVYIQADRPLEVGHYVRLEEHALEGFVVEVGWRTSKIRTLGNNLVVIPNARLANMIVTDYDLPEPRMSVLINVAAERSTDARRLVDVVESEARAAVKDIPGMLAEPAPFVRVIPGFTDRGIEVTLVAHVERFVEQYAVQDELRRRIDARLRQEGIALGAPRRVLEVVEGEKLAKA